jgi:quinol monooxygenase YgiN
MARLALVGTIEVTSGRKEQLLSALMAHKTRCLKEEPGTLQMEAMVPRGDATRVLLYEVYRDDAAFEVHRNGSSYARWREETAGMIVKMDVIRCAVAESAVSPAHA